MFGGVSVAEVILDVAGVILDYSDKHATMWPILQDFQGFLLG